MPSPIKPSVADIRRANRGKLVDYAEDIPLRMLKAKALFLARKLKGRSGAGKKVSTVRLRLAQQVEHVAGKKDISTFTRRNVRTKTGWVHTGKRTMTSTLSAPSKTPFRVFEAGAGNPTAILHKARVSLRRGKNRTFTAVDTKLRPRWFNLDAQLIRLGLRKTPRNLRLIEGHAIDALRQLAPNSQHVIFESYLLNNLAHNQSRVNPFISEHQEFMQIAYNKLRPGGRLVLIQDLCYAQDYYVEGKQLGFDPHAVILPERLVKGTMSEFLKERSTRKGRLFRLAQWGMNDGADERMEERYAGLSKKGFVKSYDELLKPTMILLRKPKNAREQLTPELPNDIGDLIQMFFGETIEGFQVIHLG